VGLPLPDELYVLLDADIVVDAAGGGKRPSGGISRARKRGRLTPEDADPAPVAANLGSQYNPFTVMAGLVRPSTSGQCRMNGGWVYIMTNRPNGILQRA
jgi:hypothetical protein